MGDRGITLLHLLYVRKFQSIRASSTSKASPNTAVQPPSSIRGTGPLLSRSSKYQVRKRNATVSSCPRGFRESLTRKQKAPALPSATKGLDILRRVHGSSILEAQIIPMVFPNVGTQSLRDHWAWFRPDTPI